MKALKNILIGLIIIATGCKNREKTADAYGNFTATEILVSSECAGKVISKKTDEGMRVESGDVAFVIDTLQNSYKKDELMARRQSVLAKSTNLSAQIDVLNEQKKALEVELKRFSKMLGEGAATQKQLDDIISQISVLDKQIVQVKTNFVAVNADASGINASLAQIEDLIKRATVTSPAKGTVLETYAEQGETVTMGKPLFKVANLDEMELKAYFSGSQLPLLKIGEKVRVLADDGKGGIKSFNGTISWIASEAEFTPKIIQTREERVNLVYAVKIKVPNDGTIKINMPGEVKLSEY
jgi:HlyD family secretion protein